MISLTRAHIRRAGRLPPFWSVPRVTEPYSTTVIHVAVPWSVWACIYINGRAIWNNLLYHSVTLVLEDCLVCSFSPLAVLALTLVSGLSTKISLGICSYRVRTNRWKTAFSLVTNRNDLLLIVSKRGRDGRVEFSSVRWFRWYLHKLDWVNMQ